MGEYDEIVAETAEQQADRAEQRKLAAVRSQGRDAAILRGRLLGEDTARLKRESGEMRDERVRRAMAYAAWEYDGKPSGAGHLREFGLAAGVVPSESSDQAPGGRDHRESPAASPTKCSREARHHINHSGKPCPECGYPTA